MKIIRKNLKVLSLFTMMCVVIVSCEKYDIETQPIEQASKMGSISEIALTEKFSGEEIFKGIFFMENEISSDIKQISDAKSNMMQQPDADKVMGMLEKLRDISVDYINKNYPNLFNELQEAAYSNNLYELESKINQSAMIIEQAGRTSPDFASVFELGDEVKKDDELMEKLSGLDLTKKEDQAKFQSVLDESSAEYALCVPFIFCALAIFYAFAIAVSIFIFLYSVITKVAYWDVFGKAANSNVASEQLVADLGMYFSK